MRIEEEKKENCNKVAVICVGTYPPVLACFFVVRIIPVNSVRYDAGDHLLGGCHIDDGQRSVFAARGSELPIQCKRDSLEKNKSKVKSWTRQD